MRRTSIVAAISTASSLLLVSPGMLSAQKGAGVNVPNAAPALVEAHQQIKTAVAKAHAEKKSVLVKFSASWCGPCHAFDRFLFDTTGVGAIMQKYFVIVGMTVLERPPKDSLNTPGALQLSTEMGGNLEGDTGIPYFFMLNGDGKKTGDSKYMPDKSNIGDPETEVEVESFDRLLQQTAPAMTPTERARLKRFLDKAGGRP